MKKTAQAGIPQVELQKIIESVEEIKELLSSDLWNNIFLNCSKNEVLIFWLLYQKGEVNMSEIAEYVHVPLNTATGIVNRMEKNEMIVRTRSKEDKRVVLIAFSEKGMAQFQSLLNEVFRYGIKVMDSLTPEEMDLFFKMITKVKDVLRQEKKEEMAAKKVRKITIE
ncbi:MAG: MarR family transcriptional regulator [Lachnospiraceae bacterium]|nr:MarR family transcriptional regulator [Lachnospiraceae bacterium]